MSFSKQEIAAEVARQRPHEEKCRDRLLASLKSEIGEDLVEMWFDNGKSIEISNDQVTFFCPNEFYLSRVKSRYDSAVKRSIENQLGTHFRYRFELTHGVPRQINLPFSNEPTAAQQSAKREKDAADKTENNSKARGKNSSPNPFYFGETNRLADAGMRQMFHQPGQMSPLVFYGPCGCGKTHLLESMVHDARRRYHFKRCVYLSAEQFTTGFVSSLHGSGLPVFRQKYRDLDLLAIDDVQFFVGKNATLAEFQHTIDTLARNG